MYAHLPHITRPPINVEKLSIRPCPPAAYSELGRETVDLDGDGSGEGSAARSSPVAQRSEASKKAARREEDKEKGRKREERSPVNSLAHPLQRNLRRLHLKLQLQIHNVRECFRSPEGRDGRAEGGRSVRANLYGFATA